MTLDNVITDLSLRIGDFSADGLLCYLRSLPSFVPEKLRERAFRRTIRLAAARSPYYRRRFLERGIDAKKVRIPEELGGFYVEADDVRNAPEEFLCGQPELAVESSGTTGHATRVYLSRKEIDYNAREGLLLKAVYGIDKKDRVLSTFDYGFCLDGQIIQRTLPHWRLFGMCVGRIDPVEAYRKLSTYRFNVVMSGTPWLARFTEVAEAEGRPFPLKLLMGGGGGGVTGRTRERIESFWEAPLCMTYGLTETGTLLGFECLRRDGYHLNEFDFYVEILNPDGEGYGEVVVTTVNREVMPLIRYRTKDVARLLPERCPCGLPFRRLSPLRGRLDEIVASVWGNVHPDFFESMLSSAPGLTEDWQIKLLERDAKQTFEFHLELQNGAHSSEEVREAILQAIEKEHPLAWQAYRQKLAGVDFIFHPKGSLRKGRKILRLIDERRAGVSEGAGWEGGPS